MDIKIKRIVIWGLRTKWHTHRFIHKAFYENAKKLGYETIWVEDEKKNQKYIKPGDLIIMADPVGKMIPEKTKFEDYNLVPRKDVFYCLHNVNNVFKDKLDPDTIINLQYYYNEVPKIPNIEKWGPVTYFDKESRTLFQPWGTNLLAEEFKKPVFNNNSFVFWVGSVWNDKLNRGNINEIQGLREALSKLGLRFINLRFVPDWLNIFLIRKSRIAPAIAGKIQVDVDYLPCRMFKNISYGQLGLTNVKKFKDILGDSFVEGDSAEELIKNALSFSRDEYLNKVKSQQEIVKNYTYKEAIQNIIKAFNYQA